MPDERRNRGAGGAPSPVADEMPDRGADGAPSPVADEMPDRGAGGAPSPVADEMPDRSADGAPVQGYRIKVEGYLDSLWADWFDGWALTHEVHGQTTLTDPAADQPALFGLLDRVRDAGLKLVSVNRLGS